MFRNVYGDFTTPKEVSRTSPSRLSVNKSPPNEEIRSILKQSHSKEANSFAKNGRDSTVRFEHE